MTEMSAQQLLQLKDQPDRLVPALKAASSDTLYALMTQAGSTGSLGAAYEAVRETAVAVHHERLTNELVRTMQKLDKSATFLFWVGVVVAAVVGIAQIVVPLFVKP